MEKYMATAKAWMALLLTGGVAAVGTGAETGDDWMKTVAVGLVGGFLVWLTPNKAADL